jgi:hypothetical protein
VWLPVLNGDDMLAAREASQLLPDPRSRHYWDGERSLGFPLVATLGLKNSQLGWDVYLLYGRQARWDKGSLPPPVDWMHQLSAEGPERELDGGKLLGWVKRELGKSAAAGKEDGKGARPER